MRRVKGLFFSVIILFISNNLFAQEKVQVTIEKAMADVTSLNFHRADNAFFQYYGRILKTANQLPRFWASGVYIKAKFEGDTCTIYLNDEVLYGTVHNYVEIIIDDNKPIRMQTIGHSNRITIRGLSKGSHTLTICKDTESGNGYLEFAGISCQKLLPLPPKPALKMEFIGNSITCGYGADTSGIGCNQAEWYDQHNAWMSYGPLTARALNAQWQLTSVSGIGMIHSCCDLKITMPQVFDKISLSADKIEWDFSKYIPDIVTICLGQNDGIQDSTKFCTAYVDFLKTVRSKYPKATIILLTSPMADAALTKVLQIYLASIKEYYHQKGDKEIDTYFFKKRYFKGCDGHPDLEEHQQMSDELLDFIHHDVAKDW